MAPSRWLADATRVKVITILAAVEAAMIVAASPMGRRTDLMACLATLMTMARIMRLVVDMHLPGVRRRRLRIMMMHRLSAVAAAMAQMQARITVAAVVPSLRQPMVEGVTLTMA